MSPQFLLILVLGFGLVWFLFIRPQKRRQLQQRDMLSNLQPGDEIITAGGLYATVRSVEGDDVNVEISPGTEVRLARRAVAAVISPETAEGEAEDLEDEEVGDSAHEEPIDAVGRTDSPPESQS